VLVVRVFENNGPNFDAGKSADHLVAADMTRCAAAYAVALPVSDLAEIPGRRHQRCGVRCVRRSLMTRKGNSSMPNNEAALLVAKHAPLQVKDAPYTEPRAG
jgi:hypothetical protein